MEISFYVLLCTGIVLITLLMLYNTLERIDSHISNVRHLVQVLIVRTQESPDVREEETVSSAEERESVTESPREDYTDLTYDEVQKLERERAFDERIKRLQREVESADVREVRGHIAEEMHPYVRNLPHNIIDDTYSTLPDVEIAE